MLSGEWASAADGRPITPRAAQTRTMYSDGLDDNLYLNSLGYYTQPCCSWDSGRGHDDEVSIITLTGINNCLLPSAPQCQHTTIENLLGPLKLTTRLIEFAATIGLCKCSVATLCGTLGPGTIEGVWVVGVWFGGSVYIIASRGLLLANRSVNIWTTCGPGPGPAAAFLHELPLAWLWLDLSETTDDCLLYSGCLLLLRSLHLSTPMTEVTQPPSPESAPVVVVARVTATHNIPHDTFVDNSH
ncbi:hypothetical protein J6590_018664 [Homalodisca vitripennis]|nr:hypothetical protein J6590_018664 [Homalodisca vitripennis]